MFVFLGDLEKLDNFTRLQISTKLDPVHPDGADWKKLAQKLGLGVLTEPISLSARPTMQVLAQYEVWKLKSGLRVVRVKPKCRRTIKGCLVLKLRINKEKIGSQRSSTVIILYFETSYVASMVSPGGVVMLFPYVQLRVRDAQF